MHSHLKSQKERKTVMERKKLIYNALQDLWDIAKNGYANKSIVDMDYEDWQNLINSIDRASKKYKKLRPEEEAFFTSMCTAFTDLIERELKTEIEVQVTNTSKTIRIWAGELPRT